MVDTPNTIYRDYVTDGVPSSGAHEPVKAKIREYLNDLEARIVDDVVAEAYIFLFTGQSNIENDEPYSWTPPDNLFYWNATYLSAGTTVAAVSSTTMRLSYSMAAEFARNNPNRPVYIINIGKGSEPIARWISGGGGGTDMYAACKAAVEALLAELGATKIDHLVWWQGESDYLASSTTYVENWQTVWFQFFAETWFPRTTPVTVMAVTERYVPDTNMKTFNRQLRRIVDLEPTYRAFVDTSSLAADLWDDPAARIHMTAEGFYAAGIMAHEAAFSGKGIGRNATPWQTAIKRTTQIRSSTASPTADPELQLALRSGYTYTLRGRIFGQAAASSDFKWAITGPAATKIAGVVKHIKADAGTAEPIQMFDGSAYPTGQQVLVGTTSFFIVEFDMLIAPTTDDGIVAFAWSQNTSVAENTYVFATSFIEILETS